MKNIFSIIIISFFINFSLLADSSKIDKGKSIFLGKGMCSGCHTLKEAGSYSNIGPNLDKLNLKSSSVINIIKEGKGKMPAYGITKILTAEEIKLVSFYVVKKSKKN
tara:strand:+ start:1561 stop:1881 length:321 start_codon:yes stop_codon:yes gene_type:complete